METEECPICFEDVVLEVQCKTCLWECCDECAEKWAEETNTCMGCRSKLFEKEIDVRGTMYNPRMACLRTVNHIVDSMTFLCVFMIFLNFVVTVDFESSPSDLENYALLYLTVIGFGIVFLFRFVARQIASYICTEGYIGVSSYAQFSESDEDV